MPAHAWCLKHQRYLHNEAREGGSLKALKSYDQKHATDFAYRMKDMEDCMGVEITEKENNDSWCRPSCCSAWNTRRLRT